MKRYIPSTQLCSLPYWWKTSWGQVTKFFPDEIFSQLSFFQPVFLPDFFSPDKEFTPIFFQLLLLLILLLLLLLLLLSYLFAKFIITIFFFDLLYLWLSKAILTKKSKCEWKQGIEKNNNNNNINRTRNCTFVNFKNYTTLKTSERIGFKLVLIISRTKKWVFNSFKDFVWFFGCLCYPQLFKAIQNKITAPSQVPLNLIDLFLFKSLISDKF